MEQFSFGLQVLLSHGMSDCEHSFPCQLSCLSRSVVPPNVLRTAAGRISRCPTFKMSERHREVKINYANAQQMSMCEARLILNSVCIRETALIRLAQDRCYQQFVYLIESDGKVAVLTNESTCRL